MLNNDELEIILAHCLGKTREFILSHPEYKPNKNELARWNKLLRLYRKNWPIAYIIEKKEFCGLDFFVNKNVLIPRPETELVVENMIVEIKKIADDSRKTSVILVDIGTGSGAIPIAIAKLLKSKPENYSSAVLKTYGIDISAKALQVAKKNARQHGVNIKFIQGNLLKPFLQKNIFNTRTQNIFITANLPYLTQKQFINEHSIQKEPYRALVADSSNGLSLYKKLLEQIVELFLVTEKKLSKSKQQKFKTESPKQITIFLEIDPRQTADAKILIKKIIPTAEFEIKKDLAGRDRLVILRFFN